MSETRQKRHLLMGAAYSALVMGLALCLGACGAPVPEPVGNGETEVPEEVTQTETPVDTTETTQTAPSGSQSTLGGGAEGAKQDLDAELMLFARGDVDEIDTPTIDQLDDQDLLTPAVAQAWIDGFSYTLGDATETSQTTATVDVSITCKKIGEAYNQGSLTPGQLAEATMQLKPQTTQVSVEMMLDDDYEWEPTASGLEALNSALVGTLAR